MEFKIMTFNVRGSFKEDGENVWENRRALNIATIKKYAPDIVGFQEAQEANLEAYADELTEYSRELGLSASRKISFEHVPVYCLSERFEITESGGFYLSETPNVESIGWDAMLIRPTTWLKIREKASNTLIMLVNTHFPHQRDKDETRKECANLIIQQIKDLAPDLPAIVLGDFNSFPDSLAHNQFIENGFIDTYRAAGHQEDMNTFHHFEGVAFNQVVTGLRIDWILTKDSKQTFTTSSCEVIQDAEPPIYPSDHYPLMATLTLK